MLAMGTGDGQPPFIPFAELLSQALDILCIQKDALDNLYQLLTRISQPEEALALAHEQLDTQFIFEVLDVLADTRLRSKQGICRVGQIVILPDRLMDDA